MKKYEGRQLLFNGPSYKHRRNTRISTCKSSPCGKRQGLAGGDKGVFTLARSTRSGKKVRSSSYEKPAYSPVLVTEYGVQSQTAGIFGYDEPKTIEDHYRDFCDIGRARLREPKPGKTLSLVTGVTSGLVVLQIGKGRGSFVPTLSLGKYGVRYTGLGSLFTKTMRIVDVNTGTTHAVFGIDVDQWLDGLNSCTLIQPDPEGRGPIRLIADEAEQPIEPTPGFRFYTPFQHLTGAGSGFLTTDENGDLVPRPRTTIYPLYRIGIMTLDRTDLSELLRAFNREWTNGSVFSRKNSIKAAPSEEDDNGNNGGLEKWC